MKELDILYSTHLEDSKHYTTEQLRKHYLIKMYLLKMIFL